MVQSYKDTNIDYEIKNKAWISLGPEKLVPDSIGPLAYFSFIYLSSLIYDQTEGYHSHREQ